MTWQREAEYDYETTPLRERTRWLFDSFRKLSLWTETVPTNVTVPEFIPDAAILYGAPAPFTLNTAVAALNTYPNFRTSGRLVGFTFPTAGMIGVPADDIYRIGGWIFGTQGSTTIDETIRLGLVISNTTSLNGNYPLMTYDISNNKTNERGLIFAKEMFLPASAFLQLYMNATAALGTFTPIDSTFELFETKFEP